MKTPTWEQSVEKARLSLVKTFEGRVEAALASFEQIPPGSGRRKAGEQTLAQFALAAGIEYDTLKTYREVTKWLGEKSPTDDFSTAARDVARGIGSYTTAREAMRSKKWKSGAQFAAFLLDNDPPEPFAHWTVDALRVYLHKKPTNTGKAALALAAGEQVSEDDLHRAAGLDAAEKAHDEIEQIQNTLDRSEAAIDASITVKRDNLDIEREPLFRTIEEMGGPMGNAHHLARMYVDAVKDSARWLKAHGDEIVGGGEEDDRPERVRDIEQDAFREDFGLIQSALTEVGVGTSIEEGFTDLLSEK